MTVIHADYEALAVAFTRTLELGDVSVGTKLPRDYDWTASDAVRWTRVGGIPADFTGWVDRPNLQFECFAPTDGRASELARIIFGNFLGITDSGFTFPGAVITCAQPGIGPRGQPDPLTQADRYLASIILTAHPTPA